MRELIETLKLVKSNFILFVTAIIVDVASFIAYGFFTAPINLRIANYAAIIINKLGIIMAEKPTGLLKNLFNPELRPITTKLALLMLISFAVLYLVYCIFQGTSWWITTRISKKEHTYYEYFTKFAKLNLYWMAIFIAYKIIDFLISIRHTITTRVMENAPNIPGKILLAAAILLGITALYSYPTLKLTTLFKTPLKKSIPMLIACAALYIALDLGIKAAKIDTNTEKIIIAVIIIAIFNIIKIYTARITNVHTRT